MTAREPRARRAAQARSQSSSWPAAVSVAGRAQAGADRGGGHAASMARARATPGDGGREDVRLVADPGDATCLARVGRGVVAAEVGAAALGAQLGGRGGEPARPAAGCRSRGRCPRGSPRARARPAPGPARRAPRPTPCHMASCRSRRAPSSARTTSGDGRRVGDRAVGPVVRVARAAPRRRPRRAPRPRAGRSRRGGWRRGRRSPRTRRPRRGRAAWCGRTCRSARRRWRSAPPGSRG